MTRFQHQKLLAAIMAVALLNSGLAFAEEPTPAQPSVPDAERAVAEFLASVKALQQKREAANKRLDKTYETEFAKRRSELLKLLDVALRGEMQAGNLDNAIRVRDIKNQYAAVEPEPAPTPTAEFEAINQKLTELLAVPEKQRAEIEQKLLAFLKDAKIAPRPKKTKRPKRLAIPKQAIAWGGHHYLLFEDTITGNHARLWAEGIGGHLARIESQAEYDFMRGLAQRSSKNLFYRVDGSDEIREGHWLWATDRPASFLKWPRGEPNNDRGLQHSLSLNQLTGYKMDDVAMGARGGFIVEWDY